MREHDVALGDLVLTSANELGKTSSGKIMRAEARKRYLGGGFDAWAPETSSSLNMRQLSERIGT